MLGWIKCISAIAAVGYILYWAHRPDAKAQRYAPDRYNARGIAGTMYKSKTVYNAGLNGR